MIHTDALIVGGGPAGSACARRLKQNGLDCLVLDRQDFPRFKPCAGWITPELLRDLELDPAEYPHSFTCFNSFEISLWGFQFRLPTRQYSIRRYEFDDWLLRRSGAALQKHAVRTIEQVRDGYVIDGAYSAKYLVGAGGTHCPVYRSLFQPDDPKETGALVVAQEEEFLYPVTDMRCYLWFFENRLPGYAWYVPKTNGYVNVGLGGFEGSLKTKGDTLKNHWERLEQKLDKLGLVRGHTFKPSGHSYYVRRRAPEVRKGNAFLVGDSAGLATLDMGEGIRPATQSGLLAAEAILHNTAYTLDAIPKYSWPSILRSGFIH